MHDIIKGDPVVVAAIEKLCTAPDAIKNTEGQYGNAFHWYNLDKPDDILVAGKALKDAGARLAQICAYNQHAENKRYQNACYEFVLDGVVYNLTISLENDPEGAPSITPLFANADWHEREMMELYGIKIKNHPNPRRLFLDETLDKGLLGEIVPLSIMMNGASSSDLWERILADKERSE